MDPTTPKLVKGKSGLTGTGISGFAPSPRRITGRELSSGKTDSPKMIDGEFRK